MAGSGTRRRLVAVLGIAVLAVIAVIVVIRGGGDDSGGSQAAAPDLLDPSPTATAGAAALGRSFDTVEELAAWVAARTGECDNFEPATFEELASFLGSERMTLYEPFIAEWGTCTVEPFVRLGLVIFGPGQLAELQREWSQALAEGRVSGNPDFGFGNGFALTGVVEGLGLSYLWCTPDQPTDAAGMIYVPGDVEGCVFARPHHH